MEILFADEALVAINKPAGLSVSPDGWQIDSTYLIKLMEAEYGRIWTVHRLDKQTSGVLVFARTADAHRALSLQFEHRQARKLYHALANGQPQWEERISRQPLRSNVGHKHRAVIDQGRGKPSTTAFRVLERFLAHVLLEASPLTGRTHQVRVHASALHLPLLGDSLYGAPATQVIARPALHSLSLSLVHPKTLLPVTFAAPYPADFEAALASLRTGRGTSATIARG